MVDRGKLVVVDNQVDQTTGTVKLKAEFPNQSLQLWPGQFVNVKLRVDTLKDAIVVPTAAVQRGPNGTSPTWRMTTARFRCGRSRFDPAP